jgi:endonuclease III
VPDPSERKTSQVAALLLKNRGKVVWGWISDGIDRGRANQFLLGCILNYQIKASKINSIVTEFVATHIKDPSLLWEKITSVPLKDWNDRFREYHLHRFPKAHERVWRIGKEIVDQYGGDASRIWARSTVKEVQDRLDKLRMGEQISHMIVGALCDTGQINGAGGDVKADRHVTRVVGRVFGGERISPEETIKLTRLMEKENPWRLDKPLFDVGKIYCRPTNPKCAECYLRAGCCFAGRHGAGT